MKYSQARQGRIFVVRFEDGDVLHEEIERLAREERIRAAAIVVLGGADTGSRLVVGPEKRGDRPVNPQELSLDEVHEAAGLGTLFPDEEGRPTLHLHLACGRSDKTVTGCIRLGVRVWQVMEAVLIELLDSTGVRRLDPDTGFTLLDP